MGSVLLHLVCRWDATFCSNKQKKQLSPFWSKISETIGGTIWSMSSIRCWTIRIAEFHKRLNASIDWLSGSGFLPFFPCFFGVICVWTKIWPEPGMVARKNREKCPEVPSLLSSVRNYSEGAKLWLQALSSCLAVLCSTLWPHRLSLLQDDCRWLPLSTENQLIPRDPICFPISGTLSTQPHRRMQYACIFDSDYCSLYICN